jgi:lauroyl/myristoyl acyltransferase
MKREHALRVARSLIPLFARPTHTSRRQKLIRFFSPLGCTAEDCEKLNRANLDYLARWLVEWSRLLLHPNADPWPSVTIEGESHLRAALDGGRGALVIGGHMGLWSHVPIWLRLRGYRVTVVLRELISPRTERYLRHLAGRNGVGLCVVNRDAGVVVRRALSRNEVVYIIYDVCTQSRHSVEVPLGHIRIGIDRGPAVLALRQRSAVVQVACNLRDDGVSQLTFRPALGGDRAASPEALCKQWLEGLFEELRERPDQWWLWSFTEILPPQEGPSNPELP